MFYSFDLDLDQMTLVLELLDMVKMYLHTKNKVPSYSGSKVIALTDRQTHRQTHGQTDRQTDRHTDRQTDRLEWNYYLPHTRMVKMKFPPKWFHPKISNFAVIIVSLKMINPLLWWAKVKTNISFRSPFGTGSANRSHETKLFSWLYILQVANWIPTQISPSVQWSNPCFIVMYRYCP